MDKDPTRRYPSAGALALAARAAVQPSAPPAEAAPTFVHERRVESALPPARPGGSSRRWSTPASAVIGVTAALLAVGGTLLATSGPDVESSGTRTPPSSVPSDAAEPAASDAAGDGVTTVADVFGPACSQIPDEGEGSAQGMIDDPVATAASNNSLLSTLATAVGAVDGLADTLDSAEALTVLAPINDAFDALPAGTFETLVANPDQLAPILRGHVSSTRYDAEGLIEAGSVEVLSGGTVTVGGTADAPTFAGGDGTTAANLCGNLPTANATVFVIDAVLMPAG